MAKNNNDKKKILIVDDEENLVQMLKISLEQTGAYEAAGLTQAKDILTSVHSFLPDLILLDLIMPDIGGLEACEMLNKDRIASRIPIIAISGLGKDSDKLKAFKLGVVDYLVKPVKTDAIVKAIEKALRLK